MMVGSLSVAPLNTTSYLSKYIADPCSPKLPKWQRVLAVVLTVALSILTVGLIFLVYLCLRTRRLDVKPPLETAYKVNIHFTNNFQDELSSDDTVEDEQELINQLAVSIGEYEGYLPEEQAKVFPDEISEENYTELAEKLKLYRNKIRLKLHPDKVGDTIDFQDFELLFATIQNLYEKLNWHVDW